MWVWVSNSSASKRGSEYNVFQMSYLLNNKHRPSQQFILRNYVLLILILLVKEKIIILKTILKVLYNFRAFCKTIIAVQEFTRLFNESKLKIYIYIHIL